VDTIPTSANQEDHVSMGAHGARQLRAVLENVQNVLGIELMCAAQALDFQQLRAGRGVQAAWEYLRRHIPNMTQDRYYRPDLIRIVEMVKSGELLRVAQDA
jgi:histidine ammonia-lyase